MNTNSTDFKAKLHVFSIVNCTETMCIDLTKHLLSLIKLSSNDKRKQSGSTGMESLLLLSCTGMESLLLLSSIKIIKVPLALPEIDCFFPFIKKIKKRFIHF